MISQAEKGSNPEVFAVIRCRQLFLTVDTKWPFVGDSLERLRSGELEPEDIPEALRPLLDDPAAPELIRLLLRPANDKTRGEIQRWMLERDTRAITSDFRAWKKELLILENEIQSLEQSLHERKQLKAKLESVSPGEFTNGERNKALRVVQEKLSKVELRLQTQRATHKLIDQRFQDFGSEFMRVHLTRFCRNDQLYSINPRNFVTAIAGLPLAGWEQSIRSHRALLNKHPDWRLPAGGSGYRLVEAIKTLISSLADESLIPTRVQTQLNGMRSTTTNGFSDLKRHSFVLTCAIEQAVAANSDATGLRLAYAIAREYLKLKERPTKKISLLLEIDNLQKQEN